MRPLLTSTIVAVTLVLSALPASASPLQPTPIARELPPGRAGVAYAFRFSTEGGLPPFRWSVVAGEIPPGISVSDAGEIAGTPTAPRLEPYAFDVEVRDSSPAPQVAVQHCILPVAAAPLRIVYGGEPGQPAAPAAPLRIAYRGSPAGTAAGRGADDAQPGEDAVKPGTFLVIDRASIAAASTKVTGKTDSTEEIAVFVRRAKDADETRVDTASLDDEGTFTATLTNPLLEGEWVTVRTIPPDGAKPLSATEGPVGMVEGHATYYDWGLVRAYFSADVLFSKEHDEFSKNDLGLGFNLDKTWHRAVGGSEFRQRVGFNTYFDTRLTSIPVQAMTPAEAPPPTTPGDMAGAGSRRPRRRGTGGGDSGDAAETPADTFLASRKAAFFEGGAYIPIGVSEWTYRDARNVLFVAPIGKLGFQTVTNGQTTLEAQLYKQDDVFHFFGGGVRLGHYRLSDDPGVAHELVSYLDIVRGKWENFEGLDDEGKAVPGSGRWGVEGRLKIPLTPLFVGFNANLGHGPDDVRYVFGTRFDVGTLLAKLKGIQ